MKVTVADLRQMNACEDDLEVFTRRWPDGVDLSVETIIEAIWLRLDVSWWAVRTFGAEYDRQIAPLRAEYDRQKAALIMSLIETRTSTE